ncbi:DUF3085 domain-containing protein [Klebsiella pneumoniae]|nr:DUF3085 domain-containing protein [Klebsiella pneumoniae]
MLRFYGSDLKAIVTESITTDKSVVLAKDHGVYLMVDGGEQRDDGRVRHLAYADGCHPDLDPEWVSMARILVGGNSFEERIPLTEGGIVDIITKPYQLSIMLKAQRLAMFITGWQNCVPVAEYRHLTDRINVMAQAHFTACRSQKELKSWRMMAQRLLVDVAVVGCKRAKADDHHCFLIACRQLQKQFERVTTEGVIQAVAI